MNEVIIKIEVSFSWSTLGWIPFYKIKYRGIYNPGDYPSIIITTVTLLRGLKKRKEMNTVRK